MKKMMLHAVLVLSALNVPMLCNADGNQESIGLPDHFIQKAALFAFATARVLKQDQLVDGIKSSISNRFQQICGKSNDADTQEARTEEPSYTQKFGEMTQATYGYLFEAGIDGVVDLAEQAAKEGKAPSQVAYINAFLYSLAVQSAVDTTGYVVGYCDGSGTALPRGRARRGVIIGLKKLFDKKDK